MGRLSTQNNQTCLISPLSFSPVWWLYLLQLPPLLRRLYPDTSHLHCTLGTTTDTTILDMAFQDRYLLDTTTNSMDTTTIIMDTTITTMDTTTTMDMDTTNILTPTTRTEY